MSVNSFNLPVRTLMGPGPSDVNPRILSAMARPTIGHLDPEFIRMMDEVKSLLQYAMQTENELTMESVLTNMKAPINTGAVVSAAKLVAA